MTIMQRCCCGAKCNDKAYMMLNIVQRGLNNKIEIVCL